MTTTIDRLNGQQGQGQDMGQGGDVTVGAVTSKQAKRIAKARKASANKASRKANDKLSTHVTMQSIQQSAKDLAKALTTDEQTPEQSRLMFWQRVDAVQEALAPLKNEAERKALVSLTQAQMTLNGRPSVKNQTIRHLACAADVRKSYPALKLENVGERKLESTILKWMKGSFTDLLKHGIGCFLPRTDEVKLPDGTKANGNEIFDELPAYFEMYTQEKPREKTTAIQRAKKAGERIASFLNKENKREKSNIVTVLSALVDTLDDGMRVKLTEMFAPDDNPLVLSPMVPPSA